MKTYFLEAELEDTKSRGFFVLGFAEDNSEESLAKRLNLWDCREEDDQEARALQHLVSTLEKPPDANTVFFKYCLKGVCTIRVYPSRKFVNPVQLGNVAIAMCRLRRVTLETFDESAEPDET